MKPTTQTILGPPDGNCLAACLASLLEVDIDSMPNYHGDGWWDKWCSWLTEHHGAVLYWVLPGESGPPPVPYIGIGPSPRDPSVYHCVVMIGGEVAHDPHPDGSFDPAGIVEWDMLLKVLP